MQEIKKQLEEIDKAELTEKQEAQFDSCLKKLEKLDTASSVSGADVDNLRAKVGALLASTKEEIEETGEDLTDPESPNGGDETGASTSEEDTTASGSEDDLNQDDTSEKSDASDDEVDS